MSSLLVTGGARFIGANFVHYWLQKYPDDRVVILDALTYAGNRANLDGVRSRFTSNKVILAISDWLKRWFGSGK